MGKTVWRSTGRQTESASSLNSHFVIDIVSSQQSALTELISGQALTPAAVPLMFTSHVLPSLQPWEDLKSCCPDSTSTYKTPCLSAKPNVILTPLGQLYSPGRPGGPGGPGGPWQKEEHEHTRQHLPYFLTCWMTQWFTSIVALLPTAPSGDDGQMQRPISHPWDYDSQGTLTWTLLKLIEPFTPAADVFRANKEIFILLLMLTFFQAKSQILGAWQIKMMLDDR